MIVLHYFFSTEAELEKTFLIARFPEYEALRGSGIAHAKLVQRPAPRTLAERLSVVDRRPVEDFPGITGDINILFRGPAGDAFYFSSIVWATVAPRTKFLKVPWSNPWVLYLKVG